MDADANDAVAVDDADAADDVDAEYAAEYKPVTSGTNGGW